MYPVLLCMGVMSATHPPGPRGESAPRPLVSLMSETEQHSQGPLGPEGPWLAERITLALAAYLISTSSHKALSGQIAMDAEPWSTLEAGEPS